MIGRTCLTRRSGLPVSDWREGRTQKKLDRETEEWLRENDPLFNDWRKRKDLEYPYLTDRQMVRRRGNEIPTDPQAIEYMGHKSGKRIG